MLGDPLLSDSLDAAIRLAAAGHRHQERRGSGVPYVAHPFAVARIVDRAGFAEPVVIAALLHDLVEDTETTLAAIERQFGAEVAATVAGCSEVKFDTQGQSRPWEDRKRDHLAALTSSNEATRAVVLADKLHNLMSIRLDRAAGHPVWPSFHAPRDRVLWYYSAVIDACEAPDDRMRMLADLCRAELDRVIACDEENRNFPGPMT